MMKWSILMFVAVLLLLPLVAAQDSTPPLLVMFVGQNDDSSHNHVSNSLTIHANLWNRDDQSAVSGCQIDWGDRLGWQAVTKGVEGQFTSVPHSYTAPGLKTVRYRCTSAGGTTSGNAQHVNWDSIDVQAPPDSTPPHTVIFLGRTTDLTEHRIQSDEPKIHAKLWVNDAETDVTSCQIHWGDGGDWETLPAVQENSSFLASHVYRTEGEKFVRYRCFSAGGVSSGGKHVAWDSIRVNKAAVNRFKPQQESFRIAHIAAHQDCVASGGQAAFSGIFDDFFDVGIRSFSMMVSIPELGIRSPRALIDFDKGASGSALLDIPADVSEGEYYARFDVSNDRFRRVVYRPLAVGTC